MMTWSSLFDFIGAAGAEYLVFLALMPVESWLVETLPLFFSGQRGLPLRLSYKRAFMFLKQMGKTGVNFQEGLCCALMGLVFLSLPGFSFSGGTTPHEAGSFFSDPFLMGAGLLLVRLYLIPTDNLLVLAGGALILLWFYLLLLLITPHEYDLFLLAGQNNASLNGVLAASLLALILGVPLPMASDLVPSPMNEREFRSYNRGETERKYGFLIFFQALWVMFLSELILLPIGTESGIASLGSFILRIFIVIMGCTVCRLTKLERNLHSIALFLGLGLLFALAGRFSS